MSKTRKASDLRTPVLREDPAIHRLHIALTREDDGRVGAEALNLPGVVTFGASEEEALGRVREAAKGVIAVYEEDGNGIPWLEASEVEPENTIRSLWIVLDA